MGGGRWVHQRRPHGSETGGSRALRCAKRVCPAARHTGAGGPSRPGRAAHQPPPSRPGGHGLPPPGPAGRGAPQCHSCTAMLLNAAAPLLPSPTAAQPAHAPTRPIPPHAPRPFPPSSGWPARGWVEPAALGSHDRCQGRLRPSPPVLQSFRPSVLNPTGRSGGQSSSRAALQQCRSSSSALRQARQAPAGGAPLPSGALPQRLLRPT